MYKLNVDSINEVKYSNTDAHGLFSGTIETDRVVLVDGDGKYLQTDGNFGTDLKNGLVRTWSATRDEAETTYLIATTSATTTAAVFCYADVIALQSAFSNDVDAFIEYLVDELHLITIDDYESPKYQLKAATIKTAGSGYTEESIDVTVPGQTGDTEGVVTVTITEGACSAAEIKTAGSYESLVASQDLTVGTGNGKITVTMAAVSDAADAATLSLSPSPSLTLGKGGMKPMVQPQVEPMAEPQVAEPETTDAPVEETVEETVVETPTEEVSEPAQEETPVVQDEVVSEPEEVVEEPVAEEPSEPEEVAEVTEEPKQEEEPVEE